MSAQFIESLAVAWCEAKSAEAEAIERRRLIEDDLAKALAHNPSIEGTHNHAAGGFRIKIVSRLDHKVDAEKIQEIAHEHGLTDHLSILLRWKPEVSVSAWKAADESITRPLLGAITTKPGRPSFSIERMK